MSFEEPKNQNEPLDAMLAKARWPEASGGSKRRLEEFWKEHWTARPIRANWLWPTAAAAAMIVGLGSVIVLVLMPPRINNPTWVSVKVYPTPNAKAQPVMMESRLPTLRERLLVGDLRPIKERPATAPATPPPPPPRDAQTLASLALEETELQRQRQIVAELIQSNDPSALGLYLQLVVDRKRRDVALDALADVKDPPVQALIEELSNARVAIRFAAARALGRIDGPVTTEQLAYLIQRNTQRREALAALLYSDGPDASAFLANARNVPALAGTVRAVEIQLKSVQ